MRIKFRTISHLRSQKSNVVIHSRRYNDLNNGTNKWSELIENAEKITGLILKAGISLGVLIVFSYCFFFAGFFPVGLTLGDSLFFVFVFLGFGIIGGLLIGLGFYATTPIYRALRFFSPNKQQITEGVQPQEKVEFSERFSKVIDFIFQNLLFPLIAFGLLALLGIKVGWEPVWGLAIGGFLLNILIDRNPKQVTAKAVLILLSILTPFLLGGDLFRLTTTGVMGKLGIFANSAVVSLSDENYQLVETIAKQRNLSVFSCSLTGQQTKTVYGVRVWWHGLGERSLIEIGMKLNEKPEKTGVLIELKREGMAVIRPDSTTVEHCIELKAGPHI